MLLWMASVIALLAAATSSASPQTAPAHPVVHKAPATKTAMSMTAPVKVYGTKGAPITMEVFTDYECPICRVFFEQTLRFVINDYVASGKVYIIHHDFPLVMHPYSGQAARWANAAATVGQFGSAESALYDNQAAWSADGNMAKFIAESMPSSDFQRVAAIMRQCTTPAPQDQGPGIDPMAKSGDSCPVDPYIAQDIELGNKDGVNATPTYIITYKGQRLPAGSSAVSWPILKQFFDSLLSQ
jgi:protein-disulfide isomerase